MLREFEKCGPLGEEAGDGNTDGEDGREWLLKAALIWLTRSSPPCACRRRIGEGGSEGSVQAGRREASQDVGSGDSP